MGFLHIGQNVMVNDRHIIGNGQGSEGHMAQSVADQDHKIGYHNFIRTVNSFLARKLVSLR